MKTELYSVMKVAFARKNYHLQDKGSKGTRPESLAKLKEELKIGLRKKQERTSMLRDQGGMLWVWETFMKRGC